MTPDEFLEQMYAGAMGKASGKEVATTTLATPVRQTLDMIANKSENNKGVLAVVMTSLVYKTLHPEQDVRRHQSSIEGGYAGRGFDFAHITPFLKKCKFPAMAESGWLTRSLEQKSPYDYNFKGAIKPSALKKAFLDVFDYVEERNVDANEMVDYLMQSLIILRDKHQIRLSLPNNLSKADIVHTLHKHFHYHYQCKGASRLPVLALYAAYQCTVEDCRRYDGKQLLPLESHTSADAQSGRLGDIDVVDENGNPFEAVEVKFDIPVTYDIVEIAKEKIIKTNITRYYILSTAEVKETDRGKIHEAIQRIKAVHGCDLEVNGVESSLKYYLRLISSPAVFLRRYTALMESDEAVMYEHKAAWNELV